MNSTIDIVRAELERLFSLDEMTAMSQQLLGLDPADVGGATARASFARALTERCAAGDRLDALVDVIVASRQGADPRVREAASFFGSEELEPGRSLGPFTITRRLGEHPVANVYAAQRGYADCVLKVLRRQFCVDKRAVQRLLTLNRMVATLADPGLPAGLDAGETDGSYWISYDYVEEQPLSVRFARTGPINISELKPILSGILRPLSAMHTARIPHGDLHLDSVLVGRETGGHVTLVDFGIDRLRERAPLANGHGGLVAVFGSPKTMAPEQIRGHRADTTADVYAFGAMMYELLSGVPVFQLENPADIAFAHLTKTPEPPSTRGPRGWIGRDVDAFVLSLLAKDPDRRPRNAGALLDALESLGRASLSSRALPDSFPPERLSGVVEALIADPLEAGAADALETAIDEGADPQSVVRGFQMAAEGLTGVDSSAIDAKKSLLHRAARTLDVAMGDKVQAERVYETIVELDPTDVPAHIALEAVRRSLGKHAEVVESLLARSETAASGSDKAHIFAEIGRICEVELQDPEQGLLAYSRALCETPLDRDLADEIERVAEARQPLWNEVLATVVATIQAGGLAERERCKLLAYAGRWYERKLARADLAVEAYREILALEPLNDEAHEGLSGIYNKAHEWSELVSLLTARAEASGDSPRARDLRAEAAEVLDVHLDDSTGATEIFRQVLKDDPTHERASAGMVRLAERSGDYPALVEILERRAKAHSGHQRTKVLLEIAEIYEQQLGQLPEAEGRYQKILEEEPGDARALKGLDRIYNRTGKYRELLEILKRQVDAADTPRQRVNLFERMAALYEDEFLDHASAANSLEDALTIDPVSAGALLKLPRYYRILGRWELLEQYYERQAKVAGSDAERIERLMHRAHVLWENLASPDTAMRVCEQVLEVDPNHGPALEMLARLREQAGDAQAALKALETLAASASTPEARAEHWMRAGRLLEERGDLDLAIERYKLAIDASPGEPTAASALRRAYAARGDAAGVVGLIEKELATAEGKMTRARLYGELARVLRDKLRDVEQAEANAKTALELDPTNADGLLVLGEIAFDRERYVEASKYLEALVLRASSLPKGDAVRALVRFVEAFGRGVGALSSPSLQERSDLGSRPSLADSQPRLISALESLDQIAPEDVSSATRVARILFEYGDSAAARSTYTRLLERHGANLSAVELADAQWRLGELLRRVGELDKAVDLLKASADADPTISAPLNALARVYEATGDWEEFTRVKRRRLEMASGAERFELLMEIGDAEFKKLGDRARAAKTYLTALDERRDDRKLLTKLMELFSEEKDWASLVDVVLRLAGFVEDPKQRAKYMQTAAIVSARQLGEVHRALEYYDRALEFDPTFVRARDEAIDLCRQAGDSEGVERLLKDQLDQAKRLQDRELIVRVLDSLGELYQKALNEPSLAIGAYEAAQAFDPDGKERATLLADLYASDVTKYLDKAVKAHGEMLAANPYRVESYKLLRRLYTEARRPDPAWCLCQALSVLGLAEADEERFYRRHRADNAAAARSALDAQDWAGRIAHRDADPLVTHIFSLIQPTIIRARTQSLQALGFDEAHLVDIASEEHPVCQTLNYAQGVFGFEAPPVFQDPNDPAGLGFVHAHTPSILLGRAAFESDVPNQALAFVVGRHLTYFLPGYYIRHLVPTGTGLKGWLFAAVKLCVPQFPIAPDLQGQVEEAFAHISADFQGVQREMLASMVSKLLQSGGAIDLKKWVAAIDLTADRAGFILANDLGVATEIVRATEDASSVPSSERVKDIVLYGVSTPYFELREKLGITVDS
jgi:tetratricopeptide (TPR) repeat protein